MNAIEHLVRQTLSAHPVPDPPYIIVRDNEYGPQIAAMRARHFSFRDIGEKLNMSHATVRNIYASWKARNRNE